MTESPRRDPFDPSQPVYDYPDPAYSTPPSYNPTQQLPAYHYDAPPNAGVPVPGQGPAGTEPQPPRGGSRLWLWILAGLAVLLILGLVIALIVTSGSQQETVVAPPSVTPLPSAGKTTPPRTRTTRTPIPVPPPTAPSSPAAPGVTEPVTYEVSGEGRAINITYIADGNMLQTEFNVLLPWSKQVELPEPATKTASITVVNFGSEVTCTVTVNGAQTQHRSGTGLTVCVGEDGPPR